VQGIHIWHTQSYTVTELQPSATPPNSKSSEHRAAAAAREAVSPRKPGVLGAIPLAVSTRGSTDAATSPTNPPPACGLAPKTALRGKEGGGRGQEVAGEECGREGGKTRGEGSRRQSARAGGGAHGHGAPARSTHSDANLELLVKFGNGIVAVLLALVWLRGPAIAASAAAQPPAMCTPGNYPPARSGPLMAVGWCLGTLQNWRIQAPHVLTQSHLSVAASGSVPRTARRRSGARAMTIDASPRKALARIALPSASRGCAAMGA